MSKVFKNKKHNRVWAMVLTVCLILGVIGGTGLVSFIASLHVKAEDKLLDPDTGKFYVKDDDFMVLEIVPDESMAQFGYLVKGQEPVDMSSLSHADLGDVINTTQDLSASTIKEFENLADSYKETYDSTHEGSSLVFTDTGAKETQYGYYRKVADGTPGNFKLKLVDVGVDPVAPGTGRFDYVYESGDDTVTTRTAKQRAVESFGVSSAYLTEGRLTDGVFCDFLDKDSAPNVTSGANEYATAYEIYQKTATGAEGSIYSLKYLYDASGSEYSGDHFKYYDGYLVYSAANNISGWADSGTPSDKYNLNKTGDTSLQFKQIHDKDLDDYVTYPKWKRYSIKYEKNCYPWYDREEHWFFGTYYTYSYYNKVTIKRSEKTDEGHYEYSNPWDEFWGINGTWVHEYYSYSYQNFSKYATFVQDDNGKYTYDELTDSSYTNLANRLYRYDSNYIEGKIDKVPDSEDKKESYALNPGDDMHTLVDHRLADIKLIEEAHGDGSEEETKYVKITSGNYKSLTEFKTADPGEKYLKITDGSKNKVKRYLAPKNGGNYNLIFYYEVQPVAMGDGEYVFEGLSYNDHSIIESQYSNQVIEYAPYTTRDAYPVTIKGTYATKDDEGNIIHENNQTLLQANISHDENEDPFKKWVLGLGYIDNDQTKGYDYDAVIFNGWYKEPECINLANIGGALTENTTVYAGWNINYGDGTTKNTYKVTFDRNVPEDETLNVTGMPYDEDISNNRFSKNAVFVYEGEKLVAPVSEPKWEGHVFTGWHTATPASISNAAIFSQEINNNQTLYAGWREITEDDKYGIEFYSNMGPGKTVANTGLKDMPATVTGSAVYLVNGTFEGMTSVPTPSRTDGYIFDGWYLESECLNRFNFGERITRDFPRNEITLYAKWVKNTEKRKITFKANKPSGVTSSVENMPANIEKTYGEDVDVSGLSMPTLKGNVEKKLDDITVKVITVTPEDLTGKYTCYGGTGSRRNGESLIKRADYIIINESCDPKLRKIWAENHKDELFPKDDGIYFTKSGSDYIFNYDTFTGDSKAQDLKWIQVEDLLKKISGSSGYKPCPVMFDYAIYNRVASNPANGIVMPMARKCSDGGSFSDPAGILSFKDNVYKLYLLATQANPITFYNAYFLKENKFDSSGKYVLGDGDTYTNPEYWNQYTLIPFKALNSQEFKSDSATALASIGVKEDTSLRIGDSRYSSLYNRFYVYGYENGLTSNDDHPKSMVGGFLTPIFSTLFDDGGEDVKTYYEKDGAFSPAQVSYYLLKSSTSYANFTTDISILEIEPCDTYKNSDYWFWYISRTLPNYLGSPKVTGMTSAEFNGSVLDIESNFDIVYFGVNDNTLNRDLLFNVDKNSNPEKAHRKESIIDWLIPSEYLPGKEITVEVTQTIDVAFEKKETKALSSNFTISNRKTDATPYPFVKTWDPAIVKDGVFQINTDKLGIYAEWFGLSTYLKDTAIFGAPYYRYKNASGNYVEFNEIGIRSSISGLNNYIGEERGYTIEGTVERDKIEKGSMQWLLFIPIGVGDYRETHFYIDQFYWGANGTETEENWVPCNSGTTVYAGDVIRFTNLTEDVKLLNYNYVYTHVGPSMFYEDTVGNAQDVRNIWVVLRDWLVGVFGGNNTDKQYEEYVRLLGTLTENDSDNIASFVFSGNDITKTKYDELVRYANIGHPIVFGRDVLKNDGTVNDRMIDSSTNIYKLINKLKTDHPNSCFEAMKTDKDDIFATTIQHFAFSIDVTGPTEYSGIEAGDAAYVEKNDDGSTTLNFELKITNNSSRNPNYSVAVYVDTNSDGKFSPVDEIINDIAVVNESTNTQISDTSLKAGQRYRLQADIGAEYEFGVAYWQLVVTDLTTRKQTGADGKAGIKAASDEKTPVYVLQIEPNPVTRGGVSVSTNTVPLPTYEERVASPSPSGDTKEKLDFYTKNLKDYELVFCRQTLHDMAEALAGGNNPKVGTGPNGDVYLGQIDVIVIGCGKAYEMTDDKTITKIKSYIAAGKPVIFTGDTVSYCNLSEEPSNTTVNYLFGGRIPVTYTKTLSNVIGYWGYDETQAFRNLLGMDRFGVTKNIGDISLINADANRDKPYMLNSTDNSYYTASTTEIGTKGLVQGFSNPTTALQFNKEVNQIVSINEGQITTYPYALTGAAIKVASTISGYYQLDLDSDDITVWYTLSSDKNRGDIPGHKFLNEFYYGADATNNYYLYTKKNITYSGIGRSTPEDDELKLFVNTIIAASRTGVQPTVPIITNVEKASTRKGFDYLYIDFDASLARNDETSTPFGEGIVEYSDPNIGNYFAKRVFFTLKDYSIIDDKKMLVTAKPAVLSGTSILADIDKKALIFPVYDCDDKNVPTLVGPEGNKTPVMEDLIKFRYTTNNYGGGSVENDKYYFVDVPISDSYYQYYLYHETDKSRYNDPYVDGEGNSHEKFTALDLSDAFYMKLNVVTIYTDYTRKDDILTTDEINAGFSRGYTTTNEPLVGEKGVCIMRRGMFALD